jgi:hypothetical protein
MLNHKERGRRRYGSAGRLKPDCGWRRDHRWIGGGLGDDRNQFAVPTGIVGEGNGGLSKTIG